MSCRCGDEEGYSSQAHSVDSAFEPIISHENENFQQPWIRRHLVVRLPKTAHRLQLSDLHTRPQHRPKNRDCQRFKGGLHGTSLTSDKSQHFSVNCFPAQTFLKSITSNGLELTIHQSASPRCVLSHRSPPLNHRSHEHRRRCQQMSELQHFGWRQFGGYHDGVFLGCQS